MGLAQDTYDLECSFFFKRCKMQRALILTVALLSPMAVLAQPKQRVTTTEVVEAMPENLTAPQQVYVVQQNPQPVVQSTVQSTVPSGSTSDSHSACYSSRGYSTT